MSVLKSVTDFLPDHIGSRDVLVLGLCPSSKTKPFKGATFTKVQEWMNTAGVPHWDFHNIIPHVANSTSTKDIDWELLKKKLQERKVVIALGTFVSGVLTRAGIEHIKIDHPSPRNRNFNDPAYEPEMLKRLKKELKSCGVPE
jgi:hypothetical protein